MWAETICCWTVVSRCSYVSVVVFWRSSCADSIVCAVLVMVERAAGKMAMSAARVQLKDLDASLAGGWDKDTQKNGVVVINARSLSDNKWKSATVSVRCVWRDQMLMGKCRRRASRRPTVKGALCAASSSRLPRATSTPLASSSTTVRAATSVFCYNIQTISCRV